MSITISVIIPSYRPSKYLFDNIKSLEEQTLDHKLFEVLIILNGDKEPYINQIKKYTSFLTCSNDLLYSNEKGVSLARNIGIENANGKYIVFIDDDDLVSPDYLKELLFKVKDNNIVISNVKTFRKSIENTQDDYLSKCFIKSKKNKNRNLFNTRSYFSTSCAKIIPLKVIKERRFDSKYSIGEDCIFMALISNDIKEIDITSEKAIYFRRVHNLSATQSRVKKKEMKISLNALMDYIKIYLNQPLEYNIFFIGTRILSSIRWFFLTLLTK
jgi:glycosyltransferase involved in cell wall biosynthesis